MTVAAGAASPSIGDSIVSSRLLILQSKRLMLSSAERRFKQLGKPSLGTRTEHFRDETKRAGQSYRSAVLTWGQATSQEFRTIAYSSMVNLAESLALELRGTSAGISPADRFEMAVDLQALEAFIEQWRRNARPTASLVVA